MSEPAFVAIVGDIWANVAHIESVEPATYTINEETRLGCKVTMRSGKWYIAPTAARDFLNRMTGVVWK